MHAQGLINITVLTVIATHISIHQPSAPSISPMRCHMTSKVLRFNLVRVEIRELRPEVLAEGDGVLVHYRSRTNV